MECKKVKSFDKSVIDEKTMLFSLIVGILKASVEYVRDLWFDKNSITKLQIDLYFLSKFFYDICHVEDEGLINFPYNINFLRVISGIYELIL